MSSKNRRSSNGGGDKYAHMTRVVEDSLRVLEELDRGQRGGREGEAGRPWGGRVDLSLW